MCTRRMQVACPASVALRQQELGQEMPRACAEQTYGLKYGQAADR
jgi:hypothetical protein